MNVILFQIIMKSRKIFIINITYIIFNYFIIYRREIVIEGICYIC